MFAEVVLQRRVPGKLDLFTYAVPRHLALSPGERVVVPFRKQRLSAVVVKLRREKPAYETREIFGLLEGSHLAPWQVSLVQFMTEHYLAPYSKIIPLFFPSHVWKGKKLAKPAIKKEANQTTPNPKPLPELSVKEKRVLSDLLEKPKPQSLLWMSKRQTFYLHLIARTIKQNKTAALIFPEITFTESFLQLFEDYFPGRYALLHSGLKASERTRQWLAVEAGEASIVIGSRLALFAPFKNLGLLILDSEEDPSFKQEQTPYYHSRDIALHIGKLTNAQIILGTSSPSLEAYELSREKGGLVKILEKNPTPIRLINVRDEQRKGNYSLLTDGLREKLVKNLSLKKPSLLFLNRRGSSSALWCKDCQYVFRCPTCELTLTAHERESGFLLVCHHCGMEKIAVLSCLVCHGSNLKFLGSGTEKIERELKQVFSLARILRLDRDTLRDPEDAAQLTARLAKQDFDILIGTQLVTHLPVRSFPLVAVLLADTSLNISDFRSTERAFQLFLKLRNLSSEEYILQTFQPEHPLFTALAPGKEEDFYNAELEHRKLLGYPPSASLVRLTFHHASETTCLKEIKRILAKLEGNKDDLMIHAAPPFIPKSRGKFRFHIFVRGKNPTKAIENILPLPQGWTIDPDPISLL